MVAANMQVLIDALTYALQQLQLHHSGEAALENACDTTAAWLDQQLKLPEEMDLKEVCRHVCGLFTFRGASSARCAR